MVDFKIYLVYDTKIKEYWKTRNGKRSWYVVSGAKNAWNINKPSKEEFPEIYVDPERYWEGLNFNDQDRFVIHELTPKECDVKELK